MSVQQSNRGGDQDDPESELWPIRANAYRHRRAMITLGLLRAGATALLLVTLYYLLPLDRGAASPIVLTLVLTLSLIALVATAVWQVRAILRSRLPGIRAAQALATVVPLFLLVFATTYFMLSTQYPQSFNEHLSRTDALYFTVTTFATVGFGDIAPTAEGVRLLVSTQVLLDLIILGLGIKVLLGAVRKSRGGKLTGTQ